MLIDLVLADRRYYTFEGYSARHVGTILEKEKIAFRQIYLSDGLLQDYLVSLQHNAPDWTISFSNVTPHHKPLCDVMQVPHFYWAEGSLASGWHYLHSQFGKLGLSDKILCQQLSLPHVVYLPHGIERKNSVAKHFDVVLFADLIELSCLEKTWQEVLNEEEVALLQTAITQGQPLKAGKHYFYAEQYVTAQQTLSSMQALKTIPLDVFGEHAGNDWLVRLPDTTRLHAPLPFTEYAEVLAVSKIAVADPSTPWYAVALAAGCLPLLPDPEKIRFYLDHPTEREQEVQRLLQAVSPPTWETQVKQLIKVMSC